jgi:hypothetical protein
MKRYSILSVVFALVLGFVVASCGSKVDEALVAEFNAKKAEAEKLISDAETGMKTMHEEHTAWSAKLDEAAAAGADTAKIAGFKAEIANHMKVAGELAPTVDSLKSYLAVKTDNADALKSGVAGLTANIGALTANWKTLMDGHTKLGADIMAMLTPTAPAAPVVSETPKEAPKAPKAPAKTDVKKPTTSQGGVSKKDGAVVPTAPAPKPATTSQGGVSKK